MIENQTFVSVIVPVHNGSQFLNRCLDAILASEYVPFEVIVVDDGSTDNSAEISRIKGVKVFSTGRRSGPAAARNIAAEKAGGSILLFVDADVIVKPDTITQVVARFVRQPEISALFGSYDDEPDERNFLSQYRNLLHHFVHQNSNSEASTFWAGLGAIRRDVFMTAGGFDCVRFSVPSIEDIELGARLHAAGHRIYLDKNIQAKHLKKWQTVSILRTDIFCRALPWSKLILTSQGLINDLNLKTSDRLSALLVGLCVLLLPIILWKPLVILFLILALLALLLLNRKILRFFVQKKGIWFASLAVPWQFLYFFYSGSAFVFCWFRYAFPKMFGYKEKEELNGTGFTR